MKSQSDNVLSIDSIDLFILDFDGVLTDNRVYVGENDIEYVVCNRSDGLAVKALKKLNKKIIILSTEKNTVVTVRAQKLQIDVFQGVDDKSLALKEVLRKYNISSDRVCYVGNDINDYDAMLMCGCRCCPYDSNDLIKSISQFTLDVSGGQGVVRCLVEKVFKLSLYEILYKKG